MDSNSWEILDNENDGGESCDNKLENEKSSIKTRYGQNVKNYE